MFRKLVIAHLSCPSSKAATVEYLKNHFDEDVDLSRIYRYLDKLNHTQHEKVQDISVRHTRGLLVSLNGYPLAYCIHEGNKYEGHTMMPVIGEFVRKYELDDFVVVKVYKELDRILKLNGIKLSVDKVLRMAKTVTTIQVRLPLNGKLLTRTMVMKRHKPIEKLFGENFLVSQ